MNTAQQAYIDGAVMAYKDAGSFVKELAAKTPPEFGELGDLFTQALLAIAKAFETKAINIVDEAERIDRAMGGVYDA